LCRKNAPELLGKELEFGTKGIFEYQAPVRCLRVDFHVRIGWVEGSRRQSRNEVSTAIDTPPILMEIKNILLIPVCFTDFGGASISCGLITDTWKSALSAPKATSPTSNVT